ncbi:MAG: hypothetical protein Q7U44_01990, partial [Desulfuromonadales bacterium]|nr:hypothetical protein [Desulfuromonadales bacterium]
MILAATSLVSPAAATILDQPMTGATAPGWVIGGSAYLTASTGADTVGNGWLRLTEPFNDKSGFAMYDTAFDITQGVVIQFDYATWGGSGADGYSVYLFDGAYNTATFNVGASGGSLGYDKKTVAPVAPGLSGGYIGVGIDEFGNFSSATEGRLGGPGARANSVAVRGPFDHSSGAYYYIGGTAANVGTLWYNQAFRPGQFGSQYRKVVIYLTPVAAPNYMRVDVFMQFGYNQPLTYLINTLYTMRPIPTSVKIGYAASTGGQTNYHEIRNLAIDNLPTNINLAMAKSVSSAIVAPGGALTYTVTARNYGPNLVTVANNVPIVDTVPAALTGVTWTCAGSNGGTCGAASGSGNNINTTASLPFNGAASYTISGTVAGGTPPGSILSNTATLAPPAGITDYKPSDNSATVTTTVSTGTITIGGTVYSDSGAGGGIAHNGVRDGTEPGTNGGGCTAKLFRSNDLTTTLGTATVSAAGAYSFTGVPAYGDYIIILSTTATVNTYDPSFAANWTYVTPANFVKTGVAASGSNLTGQNFFVYNGSRFSGKVIKDDGYNGALSTANDAVLNAAEIGLSGVTVRLTSNANPPGYTIYDTVTTDSGGNFTLFTAITGRTLRIYQTNPAGHTSVNANIGTTAGTYVIASDYITFTYAQFTNYSGVIFSDIPDSTFAPTPRTANGPIGGQVFYAHTFTPGSSGTVTFTNSLSQAPWPAIVNYADSNCNGVLDGGEPQITAAVTVYAAVPYCILVRDSIPVTATAGQTNVIVTSAVQSFTNSIGPVTATFNVTDTTTAITSANLSTSTKTWSDLNGGDQLPGDVLRYTITLTETAARAANGVAVTDNIPANITGFTVVSIPPGALDSSTSNGGSNGTGYLDVTGINLAASGTATIVFDVTIANGLAAGTLIDNTALISLAIGTGATPSAPTVTVSQSSVPGSGSKPLYLYASTTNGALGAFSRSSTAPGGSSAANFVNIADAATVTWTLDNALTGDVALNPAFGSTGVPINLYLRTATGSGTGNVTATLSCGAVTLTGVLNRTITTTLSLIAFSPAYSGAQRCAAGSSWTLSVTNNIGRTFRVYPTSGGNRSQVNLPSSSIISVTSVTAYSTPYAAPIQVQPATFAGGASVYIRAVVTDPFGSADITGATLLVKNSAAATIVPAGTVMTQVATNVAAGSKIYEYATPIVIPATGPEGGWTATV